MLLSRPLLARSLPFALYMAFLAVEQGLRDHAATGFDLRWLYPVKVGVVALALWHFRREYSELRERPAALPLALALLVGLLVFGLWIQLDQGWFKLGGGPGFDPRTAGGDLIWPLLLLRIAGAALVVPLMEELFWRSFLMRWIECPDFLAVAAVTVGFRAILISSLLFGLEHTLWFAGILAGLAYAGLYRFTGNLWLAVAAHACTNLILGLWVVQTGAWQFW